MRPRHEAGIWMLLCLLVPAGAVLAVESSELGAVADQAPVCAAVLVGAESQDKALPAHGHGSAFEALLEAYYAPLADPRRGRLYEATAELLSAGRALPESMDLGFRLRPTPAGQGQEATSAEQPAAAPQGSAAGQGPRWVEVLDHPVVGEEELAHAYFLARSYAEAADIYRLLHERNPEDTHLLLMLLLSERNAGNADEARRLLSELQKKGTEPAKWAEWMAEMMDLTQAKPETLP